jgi:hypothetical protein
MDLFNRLAELDCWNRSSLTIATGFFGLAAVDRIHLSGSSRMLEPNSNRILPCWWLFITLKD